MVSLRHNPGNIHIKPPVPKTGTGGDVVVGNSIVVPCRDGSHCNYRNKYTTIYAIPVNAHITPPKRVLKMYSAEGSEAELCFHPSANSNHIRGKMIIETPTPIKSKLRMKYIKSPLHGISIVTYENGGSKPALPESTLLVPSEVEVRWNSFRCSTFQMFRCCRVL